MSGDDHTPDSRRAEFLADALPSPPSSRTIMPSSRRMSIPVAPGSSNSIPPSSLTSLHKAIGALDKMKAKLDMIERRHGEPIAIVGMACRFPGGADSPEAFFQALEAGVDAVTQVPEERWRLETTKESDASPEQRAVRWGAFLAEPVDRFDARFFGISPREAVHLDPQHRLLLEVSWEALERAGLDPTRLMGSLTGVFVGITTSDYAALCKAAGPEAEDAYSTTGNIHCFAPGRLSYTFGLQGPSLAVDTACSSSLVAIHLACQSLRTGEATLAIAGGVNLMLTPDTTRLTATTMGLSPDGRCKTFDASANGFVRSEGCGLVVLKRLSDAQRDGDHILATIRGSAVNQDGRSTGMTAPNVLSQQAMLRQALANARVTPEEIGYVETHGTGTSLGDPIEIEALRAVLGKTRLDGTTCALGAVKSNVGHLEAAAGVAGLIKAVMTLQRESIPGNMHFRTLNPRISLEGTPFVIPTENVPWARGLKPRLAGVSAFGLSGTNAHMILEEAPREKADESAKPSTTSYLLPISARSAEALHAFMGAYAKMLSQADGPRLEYLVATASLRRPHHEHRVAIAGRTREEMAQALGVLMRTSVAGSIVPGRAARAGRPKVVFVFPGQGSQWLGMGRQLVAEEPAFRTALEHCDEVIRRQGDFSVLDELEASESLSRLGEIQIVQPLLFAIQVALAALWRSWGIEPDAVVGHSMGEVAAARVAGILSLEDAAKVICRRSRILRRASGKGAMALVELGRIETQLAIAGYEDRLSVAVSNGPQSTVISGDPAALDEVLQALDRREVFCRRVKVDVASHSPQMDPLKSDLLATLRNLRPRSGQIAMRSTVTGEPVRGPELDAAYWVKNLRDPVLFLDVTQRLIDEGHSLFVEMSPHPILVPSVAENLQEKGQEGVAIASMRRDTDERQTMLEALGVLYTRGHAVDWKRIYPHESRSVPLPPYPWQRERHWVQGAALVARPKLAARDPLDECIYTVTWRRQPRAASPATHVGAPAGGAWLLFGDRGGLAATLAAQLTARGQMAVRVVPGQGFACVEPNLYEVDLAREEDYQALFQAVFGADPRCRGVVHLASLDATPWEHATVETLKLDQQTGFLSVAHAARAILRQSFPALPRLWVVTQGAQTVASEPVKGLSQAPLWGLGRTLALEHPELACTLVDLEATPGTQGAMDLLQELSAPDGETQIALRGGVRHVARLVQSGFEAEPARTLRFEPDASYLITGGLSGLGLSLAGWMVEQGARHLALLGRRAPLDEAKAAIQAMEARGAEVLVFSADVARRGDVDRVLEDVTRRMPRLRGLVHAAGVVQESTLLEGQTERSFWPVMAPKMLGAAHLHAATKGTPLDFFVLYSSASAALGLIGQAAYAGANACLDAMAHALRSEGVPALSIQWGAFSEVGLTARDTIGERMSRGGLESLTPRQGNEALGRLLTTSQAEVAVMRLALQRWFVVFPHLADSPFWSELRQRDGTSQPQAPHPVERVDLDFQRSLEAATPAERRRRLALHVQQELGKVLRLDPAQLGHTDPFSGYGFDSLMGLELRNRLQTTLDIKLSMADIVTHARIDELAEFLMTRVALAGHGSPALVAPPREGDTEGAPAKLLQPGSWIVTPRPSPAARMRLFCFPYAGGSASVFGAWPAGLPSEIEVCAIQPPGRHERLHEPLLHRVEEMVAELLPALLPYLDRPFAMFGHCLGAIVMFEVLRELAEKHGLRPAHVFMSGAPAPRKYAVPNTAMRSPKEFTELLEFIGFTRSGVLGDEDAERHLLPAVKADFEVAARYKHVPSAPLTTSITAFAGSEDVFAPPDVMSDWRAQTTSWFSKIVLPGEHYFIVPERATLLRIIREELLLRLASLEQTHASSATRPGARGPGGPWLRTPAPRARPRARLFCFPGLGKSTSVYDRFPSLLGVDVEVCMIDLPGRGARAHELPLGRVDEIVDSLVPALRAHLDVPYAFFGVDIGAVVMFEAARRLRREGAAPPSHLFVSAALPPQEYFWAPMHHLPRERLFRGLRTLGFTLDENETNEQALRAECAAMASYTYADELPLNIPLVAFWGERDLICSPVSMRRWREQTTAAFAFHAWPGGHDLACEEASALLEVVREALGKPPCC